MADTPQSKSIARKVAIVTGANGGLGMEIVRGLLAKEFIVIAASRDGRFGDMSTASEAALASGYLHCVKTDLSVVEDYKTLEAAVETVGSVHVLVNNAGVYLDNPRNVEYGSPFELDIGDFAKTLQINVLAAATLCWKFVPRMIEQNYGRIVNVSSGMGRIDDISAVAPFYSLSKLLLNGLTIVVADAVRGHDVIVNSVCPGWIQTKMGGVLAPRTPSEAALEIVRLGTLPKGSENGGFWRDGEQLDWSHSERGSLRKFALSTQFKTE